jgi:HSP20 family protein
MSMTQHNPWNIFDQLQHEINRAHTHKAKNEEHAIESDWSPAVDIKEDEKQYILIADIPGVNADKIDIQMENNILSIKGERNSELKNETNGYKRIERKHGIFYRRFTLPEGVNTDSIEAKCNNGVLTVSIPKQEAVKPRKITIN